MQEGKKFFMASKRNYILPKLKLDNSKSEDEENQSRSLSRDRQFRSFHSNAPNDKKPNEEPISLYFNPPSSQTPRATNKITFKTSPLSRLPVSDSLHMLQEYVQFIKCSRKSYSFHQKRQNLFEILFDRQQPTQCATILREKIRPSERIGFFMQAHAKLKESHLLQIIYSPKVVAQPDQDVTWPIQLCYQENNKKQQKHRYLFQSTDLNTETVTLSIFPECIHGYNGTYQRQTVEYMSALLKHMNYTYDPSRLGQAVHGEWDIRKWPERLAQMYLYSEQRYQHYVAAGSCIWDTHDVQEIPQEVLDKIKILVRLNVPDNVWKKMVNELMKEYKKTMRKIIMNYILLSEKERDRLKIYYIPKQYPTSAQRIISYGGYNQKLYVNWHQNVQDAKYTIGPLLTSIYSHVLRALNDWCEVTLNNVLFKFKGFQPPLSILNFNKVVDISIKLLKALVLESSASKSQDE